MKVDEVRAPARVAAIDVLRGFVMMLMLAEVLHLPYLVKAYPDSSVAHFLAFHQSHVEWAGCSLHDLIQPAFSLLAGTALAYSIAARKSRGATFASLLRHAVLRSVLLIFLGIVLRSFGRDRTNFTFEDTLTQIGLGYVPLFLLSLAAVRVQACALALILISYWAAFALWPVTPNPDFPAHYAGFAAHWNKNANLASAFDAWFLNLFPREKPFTANGGGYVTLSFIPTLATMLIGLLAGHWLRSGRSEPSGQSDQDKLRSLLIAGFALFGAGVAWHFTGTCPFVKRIWTPSFALGSAGLVLLLLALAWWLTEIRKWRRWAFPLLVVGANSIVAYLLAHMFEEGLIAALNRHFTRAPFQIFGPSLEPMIQGMVVLLIFWLCLYWMYRRGVFIRL